MPMHNRLLIAATVLAAPAAVPVSLLHSENYSPVSVHAIISAAGSIQMQGRNAPSMAFTNIGAPITASGFTLLPTAAGEVQAVLTGNTGTVSVSIVY